MNKLLKKVESMDDTERDRLRQLLKEHKGDSKGTMEWMYKEEKPEEEDYLLGRRIDKHIDRDVDKEADTMPGSDLNEVMAKRADLDMQSKMREDPLYAIRKKEEEARRRILENPIKMKQLQKAIQDKKGDKKKKKKKKKSKKHKKKHEDDSEDSSDSDSDDELMKKYLSILSQKKHASKTHSPTEGNTSLHNKAGSSKDYDRKHKHSPKSKHIQSDSDSDCGRRKTNRPSAKKQKKHDGEVNDGNDDPSKGKGSKNPVTKHGQSSSESEDDVGSRLSEEDDRKVQKKAYGLIVKGTRRSRSKSPPKHVEEPHSKSPKRSSRKSRSNSPNPSSRRSGSPKRRARRSRSPQKGDRRSRSKSPKRSSKHSGSTDRGRSRSPRRDRKSPPRKEASKKKLSSEEMERRRQEMMEDAKQHDDQRVSNVQRYKREDDRESEQLKKQMAKESDFISPIMSDHASQSSVEDRLKRNRYHIQRTQVDLDRPFNK